MPMFFWAAEGIELKKNNEMLSKKYLNVGLVLPKVASE